MLTLFLVLVTIGCRDTLEPVASRNVSPSPIHIQSTVSILPLKDAFIKSDAPNRNTGMQDTLRVNKAGTNRILVAYDQDSIAAAVGSDSLVSAVLEFTMIANGNDWGPSGRYVNAHRMTRAWPEGGATWNCANDIDQTNTVPNCSSDSWTMTASPLPYANSWTSSVLIQNSQTGVVTFDVTGDVRGFLSGLLINQGWLLKRGNETTDGRAVFVSRDSNAAQPKLLITTMSSGSVVPATPPDSISSAVWQSLHAPTNLVSSDPRYPSPFPRNLVLVTFAESTPQSTKQAAISSIGGQVIGGNPIGDGGVYYIQIVDDGTSDPLFAAIDTLNTFSSVELASPELLSLRSGYRRPNDGQGWDGIDWQIDGNKAPAGANWGLEEVMAPLAWGCSIGDQATRVGISDTDFDSLPDLIGQLDPSSSPRYGSITGTLGHGNGVLSVLGATGDNDTAMTGVMWRSRLHVREIVAPNTNPTENVAASIVRFAEQGVRVINVSQWIDWDFHFPNGGHPIPADSSIVNPIVRLMASSIRRANTIAGTKKPLLIFIAGNKPIDAYWNGFGALADSFPQQVVVVGSTDSARSLSAFSGIGSRVQLVAPGTNVAMMNSSGNIVLGSGTSLSAPLVAGVAGLLMSFDSTLTAGDLKTLLINGALAGGRAAGGIPILNAYESLKLAAQRQGAPLCGNRVWPEGSNVKVQRGGTPALLKDVGSPVLNLTSLHGGHRLIYGTSTGVGALAWSNGTWQIDSVVISDTSYGGLERGESPSAVNHDQDSMAFITGGDTLPMNLYIQEFGGGNPRLVKSLGAPNGGSGPLTCLISAVVDTLTGSRDCIYFLDVARARSPWSVDYYWEFPLLSYSPLGDEVFLGVPTVSAGYTVVDSLPCLGGAPTYPKCYMVEVTRSITGMTVTGYNSATGASRSITTESGKLIFWMGAGEGARELAYNSGTLSYKFQYWLGLPNTSFPPTALLGACSLMYAPIGTGSAPPPVALPTTPCQYRVGTIAPTRRHQAGVSRLLRSMP